MVLTKYKWFVTNPKTKLYFTHLDNKKWNNKCILTFPVFLTTEKQNLLIVFVVKTIFCFVLFFCVLYSSCFIGHYKIIYRLLCTICNKIAIWNNKMLVKNHKSLLAGLVAIFSSLIPHPNNCENVIEKVFPVKKQINIKLKNFFI